MRVQLTWRRRLRRRATVVAAAAVASTWQPLLRLAQTLLRLVCVAAEASLGDAPFVLAAAAGAAATADLESRLLVQKRQGQCAVRWRHLQAVMRAACPAAARWELPRRRRGRRRRLGQHGDARARRSAWLRAALQHTAAAVGLHVPLPLRPAVCQRRDAGDRAVCRYCAAARHWQLAARLRACNAAGQREQRAADGARQARAR
eukprot:131158-Chlamydomonas_euryale.AAC.9